jgi:galactokinase
VAIIRRGQLDSHPSWRVDIRTPEDLSGYFGALERGADFGALAGTTAVGTFGGSEDHTAILTCRPGLLSSYRFVPIRPIGETAMPPEWTFVIASSGVEADKAGRARDSYNRASLAAGALAELWHLRFGPPQMTLAELLASRPDADAVLASLIDETDRPDFDRGVLSRRLRHFVAEDARVPEALRAFTNADGETLGALSQASQDDAGRLLQNQTEETEALARLARGNGAFAASSFGAGFGGSVWALAPVDDAPGFGQRWTKEYRTRFPRVSGVEWFLARPGPSVVEV